MKALAIFLVIWGHCILHLAAWNKNDDTVFVVINTFHVSLFMMVAGYFSTSSLSLGFGNMLLKKTKEMIIPCIPWGILLASLSTYYSQAGISHLLFQFFDCLWFLKSLFLCYILAFITIRVGKIPAIIILLASMILTIYKVNVMFPAFMLGVLLKKNEIQEKESKIMRYLWIALPIFIITVYFYDGHYFNSPNRIMGIIKAGSLNTWLAYFGKTAFRIIVGNCGALAVFCIFRKFFASMSNNPICKIGKETLGIYILQAVILETVLKQYFTYQGGHAVFDFVIAPILSLIIMIICYGLTRLLDKNTITKGLLLGRFPKK